MDSTDFTIIQYRINTTFFEFRNLIMNLGDLKFFVIRYGPRYNLFNDI